MRVAICVLFLLLATPSFAEDLYSQEYNSCIDQSGGNDFEMSECISKEYTIQDKKLNEVYKKLMSQLSDQRKQVLRDAQRQWIAYTEKNCDFYDDPEGGSMARLSAQGCMLSSRAERAKELEMFLK
jgi:uncharacterized protein YecT (DUF1311 family)